MDLLPTNTHYNVLSLRADAGGARVGAAMQHRKKQERAERGQEKPVFLGIPAMQGRTSYICKRLNGQRNLVPLLDGQVVSEALEELGLIT